ncbi:outer membrane protein [Candidatus Protochlamydia phocaeensis]|uniref:outer membrane protein n=1 Tax=Candidatus Protochlamydia phocaeensis TaxID=1414722 RepID=UPI000838683D|nr:outer membrane beta-barrel protein [Candidatus Protochlamydia phocaeensis]
MKKILTLISSVICLFVASTASANPCYESYSNECANVCVNECAPGHFYVGAFGGANWLNFHHFHGVKPKMKVGYTGALSAGYKFSSGVRVEGEIAYRRNELKTRSEEFSTYDSLHHVKVKGHTHSWAYMANVLYDFDQVSDCLYGITPYVGVGVGYAKIHAQIKARDGYNHVRFNGHSDGFAYQAIAGADYRLTEKTSIGVKYTFFEGRKKAQDHSVGVALTQAF